MTRRKMLTAAVIGATLAGCAALIDVAANEGFLDDDDDEKEDLTQPEPTKPARP